MKQPRLLPWVRVSRLKRPPVRFWTSTPVKVLTLPVLPPMSVGVVSGCLEIENGGYEPMNLGCRAAALIKSAMKYSTSYG